MQPNLPLSEMTRSEKLVAMDQIWDDLMKKMEIIEIKESDVKNSTLFLLNQKIIFHPQISPKGELDFTNFMGKKYILILDRNILTKIIELCRVGHLGDKHMMRLIGSLMFWAVSNNITVISGFALNEYANHKQCDLEANNEKDIFKAIFDFYNPIIWLEIALEKHKSIPVIEITDSSQIYEFNKKDDHYKMHYTEMMHAMSLYMQSEISSEKKIIEFLKWNDENSLFCQYTIVYILLLFSNKLKQDKRLLHPQYDSLLEKCKNQAWDLTYLSAWSTFYWNEMRGKTSYLFSTMDKELKRIFMCTHEKKMNIFEYCLGKQKGSVVQNAYEEIIRKRNKPIMNHGKIEQLLVTEEEKLKTFFN